MDFMHTIIPNFPGRPAAPAPVAPVAAPMPPQNIYAQRMMQQPAMQAPGMARSGAIMAPGSFVAPAPQMPMQARGTMMRGPGEMPPVMPPGPAIPVRPMTAAAPGSVPPPQNFMRQRLMMA